MNIRKQGSETVMKDVVHIIGHKNPDTDSIVSAIAYAQLKQKLGVNAIAGSLTLVKIIEIKLGFS